MAKERKPKNNKSIKTLITVQ